MADIDPVEGLLEVLNGSMGSIPSPVAMHLIRVVSALTSSEVEVEVESESYKIPAGSENGYPHYIYRYKGDYYNSPIFVIKRIRSEEAIGLKEAKDRVDALPVKELCRG